MLSALAALCGCHPQQTAPTRQPLHDSFVLTLAPGLMASPDGAALAPLAVEAARLLPPHIKAAIGRPILIELDPDPGRAREQLRVPLCEARSSSESDPAAQTLGLAQLAPTDGLPHRILIHPGLAQVARQGRDAGTHFACGHGSLYRTAVATLVHEVVHIYDRQARLSDQPAYQHMQQFAPQDALRKLKTHNYLRSRSPDIYEFHDISENLAVNTEYFLLDPGFKCRRPAVYQYLSAQLHHQPFPQYQCAVNTLVYAGNEPVYIDPSRIYQIHYLFAARGKGIGSRFGHSMFRIVSCAPSRTRVDAGCLEDLHDQVVLSFVANLRDDLTLSSWKGMTGGYMSQLIIRPLTEILDDYTEIDHRDLQSIPLQMTAEEIRQFIYHALELYWGYSGHYYFLTNNCADESLRLIQTALRRDPIQGMEVLTPLGLRDQLIQKKIADSSVLADRVTALKNGYLFQSAIERYEEVYRQFRDFLPGSAPRRLERYLKGTAASQRRQWAEALGSRPTALSGLFTIEGLVLQRLMKDIERQVLIRILFRQDPRYVALGERLKEHLNSLRLPWELVKGGYGVPLLEEFQKEPRQVHPRFPEEILRTALSLLKIDNAKLYHEYVQTEQNRKFMLSQILKTSTNLAGDRP